MNPEMSSAIYFVVAAVPVVSGLAICFAYSWLSPKPIAGIPHNPITSIWGDIPAITKATKDGKKTFSDYIAGVVTEHGSLSQVLISRNTMVVISDRKEMERLLVGGKCTDQSKRTNEIFATVVPTGQIALPTNETWKRHRRLTGPSMSRRYLERMSGRIAAGASDLVKLWKAKSEAIGSGAFDADLDLQLATMDAIVNITLGSSLGCVEAAYNALPSSLSQSNGVIHLPHVQPPPLHQALKAIMEGIQKAGTSPFPLLSARLFTYTSPAWRKQYNLISSFLSTAIARSREREAIFDNKDGGLATDADCVLDMIIQREAREGVEAFGKGEMLDELLTYVFAGQDTTAASLAWMVKFLPKDAEIQRRLHEEVCAVFGPEIDSNKPLDFDLLDDHERVPVLEAVVAETLRCAGVGFLTGRELIQDEIILDRFIPKGTQLMFTTALMSRSKLEWGPDADEWRPSRWLTPEGAFNRSAGPSIPFGLGQRSCFGQRLAILQVKMFAASISRAFFLKSVPPEVDVWDAVELVTRQPKACYVSLESRLLPDAEIQAIDQQLEELQAQQAQIPTDVAPPRVEPAATAERPPVSLLFTTTLMFPFISSAAGTALHLLSERSPAVRTLIGTRKDGVDRYFSRRIASITCLGFTGFFDRLSTTTGFGDIEGRMVLKRRWSWDDFEPVWWRNVLGYAIYVVIHDAWDLVYAWLRVTERRSRKIVDRAFDGVDLASLDLRESWRLGAN